jgi:CRP-like cAMP-binding protein
LAAVVVFWSPHQDAQRDVSRVSGALLPRTSLLTTNSDGTFPNLLHILFLELGMNKSDVVTPILKRLKATARLDEEDERAFASLPMMIKPASNGDKIVAHGERPLACCLIVDGFVLRSKVVGDGGRQILSFHQPGDIPDLQSLFLHVLDHDVSALGDGLLAFVPHDPLRRLISCRPNIAQALWRDTLTDAAIFREWICNVGQRSAYSRLAHLVLEIYTRLKVIGRTDGLSFWFPATQQLFAQAIGVSEVHVNRVVQELRSNGVLEFGRGRITVLDEAKLRSATDFDPLYLHLDPSL